jgi:hypothetical protein
MPIEFRTEINPVPGADEVPHGWRGLVDFGETWTEADEHLWPHESGPLPTGQSLTYGCEVTRTAKTAEQVNIRIWFLDQPRHAMTPGASFTLRDGHAERATGKLL